MSRLDTYAREKQILLLNMALTVKRNSWQSSEILGRTKESVCSIIDMDITRLSFLLMGNHIQNDGTNCAWARL